MSASELLSKPPRKSSAGVGPQSWPFAQKASTPESSPRQPRGISLIIKDLDIPRDRNSNRAALKRTCEIEQAIAFEADFARFPEKDMRRTSISINRYKVDQTVELRNAKMRNRDFETDDLRDKSDSDYTQYKAINEMFDSSPPLNRYRPGMDHIAEICIPRHLSSFEIDLSILSGILRPDQRMVNAISGNLVAAASNPMAFNLYIFRDLTKIHGRRRLSSICGKSIPGTAQVRRPKIPNHRRSICMFYFGFVSSLGGFRWSSRAFW